MNQAGAVRFLLALGVNVDATDDDGTTELMRASLSCKLDIVRLLLFAGANPDARNHNQETAVHYVVGDDADIDVVRTLIDDYNANMLAKDCRGNTPFDHIAGDYHYKYVVDCMLHVYGNKLAQYHGSLALHVILRSAEYSFVAALNDYDNHDDDYWHPPMIESVRILLPLGKKPVTLSQFRILLRSIDVELIRKRDNSGKLPIHIACEAQAPVQVLFILVEMDPATLRIADHTGSLPIHMLCCSGTTPTDYVSLRYLVDQGGVGTLTARNRMGALPLHNLVASVNPTLRTVQDWIQSFLAAVTARMNDGRYPFMVAACETSSASLSVIYELVRANPNLIIPNA
jgi:ankyrin repeat protein